MSNGVDDGTRVMFCIALLTLKRPFFKKFCCALSRQASEHNQAQHASALQEKHETLMENHFTTGSPLPSPLHLSKGWFDLYLSSQKHFCLPFGLLVHRQSYSL